MFCLNVCLSIHYYGNEVCLVISITLGTCTFVCYCIIMVMRFANVSYIMLWISVGQPTGQPSSQPTGEPTGEPTGMNLLWSCV